MIVAVVWCEFCLFLCTVLTLCRIWMNRPMIIDVPLNDHAPYNIDKGPNYQPPHPAPPRYKDPPMYNSPHSGSTNQGSHMSEPSNGGPPGYGSPTIKLVISRNSYGTENLGPQISQPSYINEGSSDAVVADEFQDEQNNFM